MDQITMHRNLAATPELIEEVDGAFVAAADSVFTAEISRIDRLRITPEVESKLGRGDKIHKGRDNGENGYS